MTTESSEVPLIGMEKIVEEANGSGESGDQEFNVDVPCMGIKIKRGARQDIWNSYKRMFDNFLYNSHGGARVGWGGGVEP